MNLELVSIQFREATPGALFAIPLRKDPDTPPFALPEWPAVGGQAFVAWNLERTRSASVKVSVTFVSDVSQAFEVKADDPSGLNLSGSVPVFPVQTTPGMPITVCVPLDAPVLTDPGRQQVALRDDGWEWSARQVGDQNWTRLIRTMHRTYTVIAAPTLPWGVDAQELYVWTEALEFACKWAAGAKGAYDAAERIARAFFALGSPEAKPRLIYCASHYCQVIPAVLFGCIDLIRFLKTGAPPYDPFVDCSVAASVVSTFTNGLGGAFVQGKIERADASFIPNEVVLIGGHEGHEEFNFHEVAWGGTATSRDPVWDACLMVDGDSDPVHAPYCFITSAGIPFTVPNSTGFRERLASPVDAPLINAPGPRSAADNRPLGTAFPPPRYTPGNSSIFFPTNLAGFLGAVDLNPWKVHEWYVDSRAPDIVKYLSTVLLDGSLETRASVDYFRCPSVQRAHEIMDVLRRSFPMRIVHLDSIGDGGFGVPGGSATVFLRANLVVQTMPGSLAHGPIKDLPQKVDAALQLAFNAGLLVE